MKRVAWNKGLTKETDERVKKNSEKGRENKRKAHLGLKHSEETKRKISMSHMGKPRSKEYREKISSTLKQRYSSGEIKIKKGIDSSTWKGEDAKYAALHLRVGNLRGKPNKCEKCGTTDSDKTYEWASISKNYLDVNDYKRLCKKCHISFDKNE